METTHFMTRGRWLVYLRVKLKSLTAEAKIIRREQRRLSRWKGDEADQTRNGLWYHRKYVVGVEARLTLIAYGYLRGKAYREIEQKAEKAIDWKRVEAMVKKYATTQQRADFAEWVAVATGTAETVTV